MCDNYATLLSSYAFGICNESWQQTKETNKNTLHYTKGRNGNPTCFVKSANEYFKCELSQV